MPSRRYKCELVQLQVKLPHNLLSKSIANKHKWTNERKNIMNWRATVRTNIQTVHWFFFNNFLRFLTSSTDLEATSIETKELVKKANFLLSRSHPVKMTSWMYRQSFNAVGYESVDINVESEVKRRKRLVVTFSFPYCQTSEKIYWIT